MKSHHLALLSVAKCECIKCQILTMWLVGKNGIQRSWPCNSNIQGPRLDALGDRLMTSLLRHSTPKATRTMRVGLALCESTKELTCQISPQNSLEGTKDIGDLRLFFVYINFCTENALVYKRSFSSQFSSSSYSLSSCNLKTINGSSLQQVFSVSFASLSLFSLILTHPT